MIFGEEERVQIMKVFGVTPIENHKGYYLS